MLFFLFYSVSVLLIVLFLLCVAYDASEVRCAVVVGAILQRAHACPIRERFHILGTQRGVADWWPD